MSNQGGNQNGGHQRNLVQEYAEINRKYVETLEANAEINRKYVETLQANADLRVQNNQLFNDLQSANEDLLKLKHQLSPRGAIELLEQRYSRIPTNYGRFDKYQWLFNNDATFQQNVQRYCGQHMTAQAVGILALNLYYTASLYIHTHFDYGSSVVVFGNKYLQNQLNLLCAICDTLRVLYQIR